MSFEVTNMLKLIVDRRSGNRVEIVIPVYNEELRIAKVIEYYKNDFDVVLLDGGSTDRTRALAETGGASVFERIGSTIFTEPYFVYYANEVTMSGLSFYMFADEHVNRHLLLSLRPALERGEVIIGNRIDWCYGQQVSWFSSRMPRGVSRNLIAYKADDLHNGLKLPSSPIEHLADIQHLQIWDMGKFLGQSAQYALLEIERFQSKKFPFLRMIRRFFVFEFATLPRRLWNQRRCSWAFQCWQILIAFAMPIVGLMCWLEYRYLMSPTLQRKFYATFYDEL